MSTLYELTSQRKELQAKLNALNLEEQTILDTLEGESSELEAKIEDYGFVLRNMESFAGAIKAEEERLAERRKTQEKKIERIKEWLKTNMEACGITKVECPAFTIAVQKNPLAVVVDAESQIPEGYMRLPEPPPLVPNKKMIADAIKAGLDVPGCHLSVSTRLVIK